MPARSPVRWAWTRTWPRRSRWLTILAIRRSGMPASGRSTAPWCAAGGFDHNAQTLRVVTSLERRYAAFDGLNLTWETLEGLAKHNGPLTDRAGAAIGRYREHGLPIGIRRCQDAVDLELWSFPSAEAQVAALADDIAYDAHDIDDGLRADLFTLDDLSELPLLREILAEIRRQSPNLRNQPGGARTRPPFADAPDRGRRGGKRAPAPGDGATAGG